ncbi:MAG: dTMP kinase [Caldilineaceae bacterium]|nr:dTMP kinase [Caldilineaceae bacterium]
MSLFVTFEGPEGSGKSTQIRRLAAALEAQNVPVLVTREPGGTAIGNAVRAILLDPARTEMSPRAETLLFHAARAQLVDQVIRPALAAGQLVLCDRYADSTLAYQGYGHGQPLAPLRLLADYATGGLTPHLTIYLDIDVREGLLRKQVGSVDEWNRMEDKALAFHQAVRLGYLALAEAEPDRWLVIDAAQSIEEIHGAILTRLQALIATKPPAARGVAGNSIVQKE